MANWTPAMKERSEIRNREEMDSFKSSKMRELQGDRDMETFILSALILGLFIWLEKSGALDSLTYRRRRTVMTPVERKLYSTLKKALENENVIVLAQVNMTGILEWDGYNRKKLQRIGNMSVDFLICDLETRPLVAIELQDRTHERWNRKLCDKTKADALGTAYMPLVLFYTRTFPSVATVKNRLEPYIEHTRT